jgi:hypothetical protein
MGVPKRSTPSNLGGGAYFGGTKGVLILGILCSLGITQQKNMSKILSFNFFPMDIMEEKIEGGLKNKMPAPFAEEKIMFSKVPSRYTRNFLLVLYHKVKPKSTTRTPWLMKKTLD